jgi:hypothetical protein
MRGIKGKRKLNKMKTLRQFIFTLIAVIGLSMAVSAQKNDPKKQRPKDPPPVINPGDKKTKPKENPPRDEKKPKKPGMAFFVYSNNSRIDLA